jgi:hypothetical protein
MSQMDRPCVPITRVEWNQPFVRGDPVDACPRLEQIVDGARRQTLVGAEIQEGVTVEARQPRIRAEPQEAARIRHDPIDAIVRQTICGGV